MRVFLLLLAIAAPFVLWDPVFWSLVQTEISAADVRYVQPDGRVRRSLQGPKAPWPDWALVPDGARLTVRAWWEAAHAEPENGNGGLAAIGDPTAAVVNYVAKLRAAGWTVKTSLFSSIEPGLVPRTAAVCHVTATRAAGDGRIINAQFNLQPTPGTGNLQWLAATPPASWPKPHVGPPC